ncbi:hypothetical protein [Salipiger abyssi]|uniref:hypothetical protein n=1 Tax=Salipiger abyssi TaxID=1250539 RepID=UPI004059B97F
MKYLPDRGIYFIHVPKCAGMSVHKALDLEEASYDCLAEDLGVEMEEAARLALSQRFPAEPGMWPQGFDHPALGHIHPIHLPLGYIRSTLPETWKALSTAPYSFAMTRAPRGRFLSALMQRLKEFRGAGAIRADDPLVREEAERVSDWLSRHDPFCAAEYAHFTRQTDFVDLDGARVVKAVFPVDRTDALSAWLSENTGLEIEIPRTHTRRQPKPWARAVQPAARFVARRLLTQPVRKALYPIWTGSGLFADAKKTYGTVDLGPDVDAFIAEYYAGDEALHREALAGLPDGGD